MPKVLLKITVCTGKKGEVFSLPYIAILNMPPYFWHPGTRCMLATVLATLPSKLTKSKILDLLVNLEGKITSTVVSIYLVFGYQAAMLCMAM